MKCMVTGAMGFVGLNIVRGLAERGHDVIAVGRQEPDEWVKRFLSGVREQVSYRRADLMERGALQQALVDDAIDVAVHAAVITATTEQVERDTSVEIVAANVGGTMEALDVAREHAARRFVYISSPSAIGDVAHAAPLDENTLTNPASIYGITKQASEQLVRRYGLIHDLSTVTVRIAQPYGPGERATSSRVRTSPIQEWLVEADRGETLETGSLKTGRDWTYIGDTVRGIVMLAEAASLQHDLYNLNFSETVSVGEVIELIRGAFPELRTDETPDASTLNPNISGTSRLPLDNRRFQEEFGWAPETGIVDGMRQYLEWWRGWSEAGRLS